MDKINLKIIKPDRILLDKEVDHVIIPGKDGDFGIYSGHTPFISVVRPGIMEIYTGTNIEKYALHDGYVTVENDLVTLLCEVIEAEEEIDKNRAQKAKERAENRLKSNGEDIDYRRAEFALKKALARLTVSD